MPLLRDRRATFDSRGTNGDRCDAAVAAAKPTPSGICPAAGGDPSGGIPLGGIRLADEDSASSRDRATRQLRRRSRRLQGSAPPQAGIRAAGFRSAESRSRTKRSAPSRSRLRPAHPIDLRRSDCRAGVPSSFGAPCSVHSETYWRIPWPSSAPNATRSQIATIIRHRGSFRDGFALEGANSRKNAPRSVLPRPTYRPTSAEAFACRRAINLGRSFLGALGTLDRRGWSSSSVGNEKIAVCGFFFTRRTYLRRAACALHQNGTKDSPSRVRFRPLPRLTFRFRVRPPGRASSYSRPVLGAAAIYAVAAVLARRTDHGKAANCELERTSGIG